MAEALLINSPLHKLKSFDLENEGCKKKDCLSIFKCVYVYVYIQK